MTPGDFIYTEAFFPPPGLPLHGPEDNTTRAVFFMRPISNSPEVCIHPLSRIMSGVQANLKAAEICPSLSPAGPLGSPPLQFRFPRQELDTRPLCLMSPRVEKRCIGLSQWALSLRRRNAPTSFDSPETNLNGKNEIPNLFVPLGWAKELRVF